MTVSAARAKAHDVGATAYRSGLRAALERSRAAARAGARHAQENLEGVAKAIAAAQHTLTAAKLELERIDIRTPDVLTQLDTQLDELGNRLKMIRGDGAEQLRLRRERLDRFSITLFGRTMAGKSTLMEILTDGDGTTIGKGGQRTTRDVRAYSWNGLEVTDVPGVAAFEGAEDEQVAFEAAKQADLILFLITDDAPQPVEAMHLDRIRRLGKPLLGLCNVKVAVKREDDLALFLADPDAPFDSVRLEELVDQFHAFGDHHGTEVPFSFVHLASRFLARMPEHAARRTELLAASRFDRFERRLITEIVRRGHFLRLKAFLDMSSAPLLELAWQLLDYDASSTSAARVIVAKRNDLKAWTTSFRSRAVENTQASMNAFCDGLREEIPGFAENHWDNDGAGEAWTELVNDAGLAGKAKKIQEGLAAEARERLEEIARELKSELRLVGGFASAREIPGAAFFDTKRAWNWTVTLTSAGLTIAAAVFFSGPLGWAASAVTGIGLLVSWLMEDGASKERKARAKLERKLRRHVDRLQADATTKIVEWLDGDVIDGQLRCVLNDMNGVISALSTAASTQRRLAWRLVNQAATLNRRLLDDALTVVGARKNGRSIMTVARVPGVAMMLLVENGHQIDETTLGALERQLGERVWLIADTQDAQSIIRDAIGPSAPHARVSIEPKATVAHVCGMDRNRETIDRINLAQQLTGLHIQES